MNRRTFNTSLLGGVVATTVPIAPMAARAAPATQPLYAWAVAIARAQNRASPVMLAQQLRISQAAASELYASMIANGAIRAPLFGGVARAADPLFRGGQFKVVETQLSTSARLKLKHMKDALEKLADEEEPDAEPAEDQAT